MAADSAFEANENSLILIGCARKDVEGSKFHKTSVMVFGKFPLGGVASIEFVCGPDCDWGFR
jgi:hypothetical protein